MSVILLAAAVVVSILGAIDTVSDGIDTNQTFLLFVVLACGFGSFLPWNR